MIDLRSDTVTQPTQAMRQAMALAPVGDDVYGDDPTVILLEREAARLTGKEKAMFVPSGTMGNQLALMTHTKRGDEVIVDENSHVLGHEVGASAVMSGVNLRSVSSQDGRMRVEDIRRVYRDPLDIHVPPSTLLCLENAHGCGVVLDLDYMKEMEEAARALGLNIHLDGARLFNAAVVLGCEAADIARYADSVMFCLSKGLCAPVGSMLCGTEAFIGRARKYRKMIGGGMRQVGLLAAAGLIALSDMRLRLPDDHARAQRLYEGIKNIVPHIVRPQINMVFFNLEGSGLTARALESAMAENDILINPASPQGEVRLVTHHGVSDDNVDTVVRVVKQAAEVSA